MSVVPEVCVIPPGPRAMLLPPGLKVVAALNVSELKAVPAGKSLFRTFALAALAKLRSSPATGAVPPQFEATLHVPLVVPVQLRMAAAAGLASAKETAIVARRFNSYSLR